MQKENADGFWNHRESCLGDSRKQGLRRMSATAKDVPLGRIGNPEELGVLVAFLASQQAGYITGTTVYLNGGLIQSQL